MPRRLTVAQAADALGITETAVRRRIGRKTLPVEREGGRLTVVLPDAPVPLPGMPPSETPETPTERLALRADTPGDASADRRPDAAVTALAALAEAAMRRAEAAERRAGEAERRATEYAAVAALHQERSANLQAELDRALALPAHEPAPEAWWRKLRRRRR